MKCRDIEKQLSAHLEGLTTPDEKERVENHLSSCQSCRKAFEELKRAVALVKGLEQVEPPPWFTQKTMSRVRAAQESKKNVIRRLFYPLHIKVPLETFATVLIAIAAVYLFRASEPRMKIQAPTATEEAVSKEEVSKQPVAPQEDTRVAGDKAAREEAPKPQHQESVTRDKDQPAPSPHVSETPSLPTPEMKKEASEKLSKSSELSGQQVQAYPQSPPAADAGSVTRAPGRGEKAERRTSSTQLKVGTLNERGRVIFDLSLRVRDAKAVETDVESLLDQLGARNIRRESLQSMEVLRAELETEKVADLVEKLKLLGEVKEKGLSPELPQGTIETRIEIMSFP